MCNEPLNLCSHEPGGDPSQPADAPEAVSSEDKLAKRILNGLGFCGHYMHFHGGGVSGKAPIICLLAKQPGGEMSQQELGMHFDLKPGSLSEILSKLELNGLIERSAAPGAQNLDLRVTTYAGEPTWFVRLGNAPAAAAALLLLAAGVLAGRLGRARRAGTKV